jgi:hypothetical protein
MWTNLLGASWRFSFPHFGGNLNCVGWEEFMTKQNKNGHVDGEAQLKWHRLHLGLYARIAKRLRINPSYVSRVARGKRQSDDVKKALLQELSRINQVKPDALNARRLARSA